jgi:hypothetical protein
VERRMLELKRCHLKLQSAIFRIQLFIEFIGSHFAQSTHGTVTRATRELTEWKCVLQDSARVNELETDSMFLMQGASLAERMLKFDCRVAMNGHCRVHPLEFGSGPSTADISIPEI